MPRGNGMGPTGMGPMTGRAAGYCAGYAAPGFMNRGLGRGFGRSVGLGLGWRQGLVFRRGRGAFRGGRGGWRAHPRNAYAFPGYQQPAMYGGSAPAYRTAPYGGLRGGYRRW